MRRTTALNALGLQTAQTGSTVGNIFQTIANAATWLADKVSTALNIAGEHPPVAAAR